MENIIRSSPPSEEVIELPSFDSISQPSRQLNLFNSEEILELPSFDSISQPPGGAAYAGSGFWNSMNIFCVFLRNGFTRNMLPLLGLLSTIDSPTEQLDGEARSSERVQAPASSDVEAQTGEQGQEVRGDILVAFGITLIGISFAILVAVATIDFTSRSSHFKALAKWMLIPAFFLGVSGLVIVMLVFCGAHRHFQLSKWIFYISSLVTFGTLVAFCILPFIAQ